MYISNFKVLYINLKQDLQKKKKIVNDLEKLGLSYKRIDAVYGKLLKDIKYRTLISSKLGISSNKLHPNYWTNRSNFKTMTRYKDPILAKVGCFLSHIIAIKFALEKNYKSVLILEDDVKFLNNILNKFTIPVDADIFYLGGSFFHQKEKLEYTTKKNILIDTDKLKVNGTFAYIIPSRDKMKDIYNCLMSVFLEGKGKDKSPRDFRTGKVRLRAQSIDFAYINHFQKYGKCYLINPVKIIHEELGSNISNNRNKYKLKHILFDRQKYKLNNFI